MYFSSSIPRVLDFHNFLIKLITYVKKKVPISRSFIRYLNVWTTRNLPKVIPVIDQIGCQDEWKSKDRRWDLADGMALDRELNKKSEKKP